MLKALHHHLATVDKFIGDAIVAFWGAPTPDAQHASHGVEAVLRSRALLREHNQRWAREGQPKLRTRFGLSTGEAVVGNVGAPDRLNYTVLGDTVNTAARLESLNTRYGTEVLATGSVVDAAGPDFRWRKVDRVIVKGKTAALTLFEPLGKSSEVDATSLHRTKLYEEGYELYVRRAFQDAVTKLEEILELTPEDGPSRRLRDLCNRLMQHPPAQAWDGVTRFDTK
jgi:adenylate cyclase